MSKRTTDHSLGPPSEGEACEQPFPSPEALRPYIGKVVAFDAKGVVRVAADTWEDLLAKVTDETLTMLCVPGVRFIA